MKYIKNIFKFNHLLKSISAVILYILISGCINTSITAVDNENDLETDRISESTVAIDQKKEQKTTESKTKEIKKTKVTTAELAEKRNIEEAAKQIKIINLKKNLIIAGKNIRSKDNQAREIVKYCLKVFEKRSLAFNDLSTAEIIVLNAKALHLLQRDIEAIKVLTRDWDKIILPDKELKRKNLLIQSPSLEAWYLKGKIYLTLARKEPDASKSKTLYKNAIKAYYKILSSYDANKCPYSSAAIKGFRKCRNDMWKKFQIKVGFPPEL